MDAPAAVQALQLYDNALTDMDRQLAQHPWLAGDSYSLADAAMAPYINRFTMLTLSNMWTQSRPNITAWFERIKARPSYAKAIMAFVTEADLKPYAGLEDWAWSKAQSLLKAA
jgi:glutathione S-transferase